MLLLRFSVCELRFKVWFHSVCPVDPHVGKETEGDRHVEVTKRSFHVSLQFIFETSHSLRRCHQMDRSDAEGLLEFVVCCLPIHPSFKLSCSAVSVELYRLCSM